MATQRSPHGPSDEGAPLLDFRSVVKRLFWAAVILAAVAVMGATVQGVVGGLTFAVLLQWGALFALGFAVVGAGVLAVHALGGARAARRRGQRLASDDIGLTPRGAGESLRDWRGARGAQGGNGGGAGPDPERDD